MNANNDFVALSEAESAAVLGGGPLTWLAKEVVKIIAEEIIRNWDDFVNGVKDGVAAAR